MSSFRLPQPRPGRNVTVPGNPSSSDNIFDNIGSSVGGVLDRLFELGGDVFEQAAAIKSVELQRDFAELLGVQFDDPAQSPAPAVTVPASSGFPVSLPIMLAGVGAVVLLVAVWPKSR